MYSQVAANKRKTIFLMAVFVLIIGLFGYVISLWRGTPSLFIGIAIFATIYAFISYFASAKIALALSHAKPVEKKDAPELYRIVENLAITAGLPMPKVYIINDAAPNAFATGRDPNHAVVAATTGLLEIMEDEELEGVIAHELSHVGNYDIRVMGIVIMLVTVIALIADVLRNMFFWGGMGDDNDSRSSPLALVAVIAMAIIAPLVATLLQLAVSRKREFLADASGVLLTRYPEGLAQALAKIENSKQTMRHSNTATAHLFIANPLRQRRRSGGLAALFSTHPPTAERVRRLHEMGKEL